MGTGPGYFTQRWARSGVLLIGGWIGGLLGAVVYTAIIAKYTENNPLLALWLTVIFFAVLVGVLSQIYFDYAVILGSASIGSYLFIRVSLLFILHIFFYRVYQFTLEVSLMSSFFTKTTLMDQ